MISLFTRAMISSTTLSAEERDGNSKAYATANSRGSLVFFIRALSKRPIKTWGTPEEIVFLFYATGSVEANGAGVRCGPKIHHPTGLISSGQRQSRHIIVFGSRVHEVLHPLQDVLGKIFGRRRPRLHDALDSIQTEFRVLRLGFNHPTGDHRQRTLWAEADDAGVGGGERK